MLKLLKKFKKKEWFLSFIALLLIIVEVWLELKMPDYMSEITKLVQTEGSKMADIITNGSWMIGCALGSLIAAIIVGYIVANVASSFSMNLRKDLFDKVESLSMNEIKQFKTNSLITRTTNDITQIEIVISMGLQLLLKAPITAGWAILKILNKSWQWSVSTAVAVVILLSVIGMLTIIVMPKFKIVQKLIDKINGVTRENLTGIRVVRAFNAEKYQEDKFEEVNNKLTNQQLFNQTMFAILSPVMYLVMNGLALAIYFIGASLINNALMANKIVLFGDMVVFSSYSMQVIMSFLMLAMIFMMMPRAQVSAERINEVLEKDSSIKEGTFDNIDTKEKGTVEFRDVSFKYPDAEEYLLKNISFKVNKGETIAFIGSTGSGKSTLINLVPRFYDATEGEVLVDGINVKKYKEEILNNKLGYIPQKAVIFSGSVNFNVSYGENGKKKTKKDIEEAIRVAQAKEFVEKMDKGYNTHLAQGGTNVSGGQKQRLAIARAIARRPEIYIFDDSFSALDYKTDSVLRKELKKYTKDATCLIVAQRIGTIMNADKIVVLDNGHCVGIGTHKELLKTCEVYKQIALSQLSKEELENE
ncbi:ABC transporter ATP-binding protein [uncultured Psychrobacillus sp.]|uniref:ABC transporter ATP-binding protein n=1 Tax=uncultured Psychrobacillus sp. TaxID=1551585 RepID=UPI00261C80E3|nr:ABC transporter ATP-binding protein [uncultured Psychrobacillus sp.]